MRAAWLSKRLRRRLRGWNGGAFPRIADETLLREGNMHARDYRDIIGGVLLIAAGLWAGFHASSTFDVGTLSRMGPGMFPASLGFILAGLGALIAIPAFFRSGTMPSIDWRPLVFCTIGVLIFALTVTRVGMVPAVVMLTFAAVLADDKLGWKGSIVLAIALSLIAYLIFRVGLGIVLEPFRWPF
jgi:hypothetical protein